MSSQSDSQQVDALEKSHKAGSKGTKKTSKNASDPKVARAVRDHFQPIVSDSGINSWGLKYNLTKDVLKQVELQHGITRAPAACYSMERQNYYDIICSLVSAAKAAAKKEIFNEKMEEVFKKCKSLKEKGKLTSKLKEKMISSISVKEARIYADHIVAAVRNLAMSRSAQRLKTKIKLSKTLSATGAAAESTELARIKTEQQRKWLDKKKKIYHETVPIERTEALKARLKEYHAKKKSAKQQSSSSSSSSSSSKKR